MHRSVMNCNTYHTHDHTHTCVHTYIPAHSYACMKQTHTCLQRHAHMPAHAHAFLSLRTISAPLCTQAHTHLHMHTHKHPPLPAYVRIHTYMHYICTHINACRHTHTHTVICTHRRTRASTLAYTHTCKHTHIHMKEPLHTESSSLTSAQAHIRMHKPCMLIVCSTTIMYCILKWRCSHAVKSTHSVSLHLPMSLFVVICTLNSSDTTFHNGIDAAKRSLSWETILWFKAVFFVLV